MATSSRGDQTRSERKPADPSSIVLQEVDSEFNSKINSNPTASGLAIVVGNTHPAGVDLDINRMEAAFTKLNFVVIKHPDPGIEFLVALVRTAAGYKYPVGYFRFIVFYFAGHGGSHDAHSFIYPTRNQLSRLYVEEGILKPFYPENSQVLGNRVRLFFFDSCLKDDTVKGPGGESAQFDESGDVILPARGNILVAYATSLTFACRGNRAKGGYWSRHLHENLVNLDMSLTTVLDITWEETVMETHKMYKGDLVKTQGPHYISCLGLVYLKHPNWSRDMALKHSKAVAGTTSGDQEGGDSARWYGTSETELDGGPEPDGRRATQKVLDGGPATQTGLDGGPAGETEPDGGPAGETEPDGGPATETEPDGIPTPLVQPDSRAALLLCKKPVDDDALVILAKFSKKWEDIGESLGVDPEVLLKIRESRLQPRDSMKGVLQSWMSSSEATWEILIQALDGTLPSAAQRVIDHLEMDTYFKKYKDQRPV